MFSFTHAANPAYFKLLELTAITIQGCYIEKYAVALLTELLHQKHSVLE
jgi:hypothetical protein